MYAYESAATHYVTASAPESVCVLLVLLLLLAHDVPYSIFDTVESFRTGRMAELQQSLRIHTVTQQALDGGNRVLVAVCTDVPLLPTFGQSGCHPEG